MTSIKKVLVLGYVWPEPNSSAAGKHMLSLLLMFRSAGWQVSFASPALKSEHKTDLTQWGISEHNVLINCSSFDEFIKTLQPDIVLFDRFMLEEQFGWRVAMHCPEALRILDTEDLHSLRQARQKALKQKINVDISALNSELAKREVAAIFRCDLSLIISDYELELLQQHYHVPAQLLHHTPFMLDLSQLGLSNTGFAQRQHFISIGNFRHDPNWDAVLWLKQSIWPLIKAQLPSAELHVYGAYPPPKATQLHNVKQGFFIKGWVDSAHKVMSEARVCIAPLRFGAGIKGKLTEAMYCGTPNITTSVGTEGMGNPIVKQQSPALTWPGESVTFEVNKENDVAQKIADTAVALYQDEQRWHVYQNMGYRWLKEYFNGEKISQTLIARLEHLLLHREQQRNENFLGQMLQHHQFKSTQYMAQWIEAKNRK